MAELTQSYAQQLKARIESTLATLQVVAERLASDDLPGDIDRLETLAKGLDKIEDQL